MAATSGAASITGRYMTNRLLAATNIIRKDRRQPPSSLILCDNFSRRHYHPLISRHNRISRRSFSDSAVSSSKNDATINSKKSPNLVIKAGLPFVLFSVLAAWVVSNAVDGKLKEQELSQGKSSISLRQAKLEKEHEDMMGRLNKIVQADFDNTKRIKRPHEVLEERRLERERRNKWYRRWWRAVVGESKEE